MRKSGNKGSCRLARSLIAVLLCLVTVAMTATFALANQTAMSSVSIEKEYDFGTVFTVPERTLTAGGETVPVTHTVVYPDGSSTLKSKLTLNQSGVYTVCYQANVDGKPYAEELQFLVKDHLYYFDTDKSSATYQEGQGLMVQLAEGDTMHFNAVIDMNALTVNDVLVQALATPLNQGRFDFQRLYFTFTDVEDPSVYLTFSARHTASTVDAPYTYAMVGGNGQLLTGTEVFNGQLKIHVEGTSNFGLPFPHSFKDSTKGIIDFRYDAAALTGYSTTRAIAELNNPEHFSTLWSGFTSGRARLSVTAGMYESSPARFCMKSLYGVDLATGKLEDTTGPVISVENPYGSQLPVAAKGGSYSVFPATARDANTGDCQVKTTAWYNYTADNATMVDIENGKFNTDRIGNYAIVYEAADKMGNVTQQVLWVSCQESVQKPTVQVTDHSTALVLGDCLVPAQYEAKSYSGKANVAITAKLDGEETDIADGKFRPEKAGTYTVTYTVTDYIGQTATATYQVEAKAGTTPVFVDEPVFPAVLVAECRYTLPDLHANDYRSGKLERKLAAAQITDAEGTKQVEVGGSFTPKVNANGDSVTVTYSCDGATYTKQVPVIQPWRTEAGSSRPKLALENYLYSAQDCLSFEKSDAAITVSAKTADAGWLFANQLIAENFDMTFKGIAGKSGFDALDITLADAKDPSISVTVRLVNNGADNVQVELGDVKATAAAAFELGSEFVMGYANGSISLGSSAYQIHKDDAGRDFAGFPSGKLTVAMEFVGARSGAAYDLVTVNGYAMSNLTSDRTGPKIVVLGDYGGSFSLNHKLTIPAAQAGDTLDANVAFHMTVTDPKGEVVTAEDGTKLSEVDPSRSYTVTLDQYGQYNVRLVAVDVFNAKPNETVLPYTINVDDEEAPVLTFKGKLDQKAKVGDVLVLPDFEVKDNITAQENIAVSKFVYTPSGRLVALEGDSNSIKATQAGTYEFRVYVSDEAGNMRLLRQAVTVAAK